ncbi:MAG TPA: aminodeoxychorismate synthase component I [bacterium]|uniref:Aminodeoxychorismate synthase component 1 n=1 Tax=candidate division TA06 bacterium ADurb.Bin417 TaxID=1852828 RepID=A0A1V5MBG4_UNCT6|nr:MAG: Aminodeoxychorismate synthase component 1 [candidate division TA06 bacterium ADurb.Bin417]HNQ35140.1 aminodeoxychorismate synthase component I [bacterium]HNS48705.1 aminodeoxychorismate synthase component I [bacterium]
MAAASPARKNFVLLEDLRPGRGRRRRLLFHDPVEIVRAEEPAAVPAALEKLQEALKQGFYVAGHLDYEAGYGLDPFWEKRPKNRAAAGRPLLWFGVYRKPDTCPNPADSRFPIPSRPFYLGPLKLDTGWKEYARRAARVKEYIARGDVYQVNYTCRYRFDFRGDPLDLYRALHSRQSAGYAAFIRQGRLSILSLSPELFISLRGGLIVTRPMKGTAGRGRSPAEDAARVRRLAASSKERAENLMIVDLLRNDLGRICRTGSVRVTGLYEIESYETLHQMTSTIEGRLKRVDLPRIFAALFPCGSVTGAPKLRAMEIIAEIEKSPRGPYCGAIGWLGPGGRGLFNVAIRTLVIEDGRGEMGVGGGLTWNSRPAAEYRECRLKGDFLESVQAKSTARFRLLETLRWQGRTYLYRREHLARLKNSAAFFGFQCDLGKVNRALDAFAGRLEGGEYRVRLLLNRAGRIKIEAARLKETDAAPGLSRAAFYPAPVNSQNPFLYHKTTRRRLYNRAHRLATDRGLFDFIFKNERGELTEGAITNLFIEKNGRFFTPPAACGLLNGIWRREFLAAHPTASERILHPEDLAAADAVYLGNSVRGAVRIELVPAAAAGKVVIK